MNVRIAHYTQELKDLYEGSPFYGPCLTSVLKELADDDFFWQPSSGSHTIAEIISHIIYWRKSLIKRLQGDHLYKGSMKSPENWKSLQDLKLMGLRDLQNKLAESQALLIALLQKQDDSLLSTEFQKGVTYERVIEGTIQHDIYHIGQIAFLKNLRKN